MQDFFIGTAEQIALSLEGVREGQGWRCRCPAHGGRSLSIKEGQDGIPLYYCHGAGCSYSEIKAAMHDMGLSTGSAAPRQDNINLTFGVRRSPDECERNIGTTVDIYRQSQGAAGTPLLPYIRSRGITLAIPEVLRFHPQAPHRCGWYFPAMIALVVGPNGTPYGCHMTFLKGDGSGKYPFPEKSLQRETRGTVGGGSVQLMPYDPSCELCIAEGIESALSAAQLFGLPAWAALSTSGLRALELPIEIRKIAIAIDHDLNGAGQVAALSAYTRWTDEGRKVRLLMPPTPGTDFNDMLLADAACL
jgi:hypothetical protein